MANVLDSLLVTIGLDAGAFKKGAAEVAKASEGLESQRQRHEKARADADKKNSDAQRRNAKEIENFGKKTADSFDKIRNQALGLAAVFTAGLGIASFVKDTITSVATIGRLSTVTDMSVKKIAAWQLAFKEAGGSAEEANAQILKMSEDITKAKNGIQSEGVQKFIFFGGDTSSLRDTQSYMHGIADLLEKLRASKGNQFAYMAAQQMGISATQYQILANGGAAMDNTIGKAEKMTGVNANMADKMQKLQAKWADFQETLRSTALTIFEALTPALNEVLGHLQKFADWAADHKTEIKEWVDKAVVAVKEFARELNAAAEAVGGWKNVLVALVALKVASAVSGLLSMAAAITQLGGALGGLSGSSAGMAILGKLGLLGAAGAAGYAVGTAIYGQIEGTSAGDAIGSGVAHVAAFFGSQDAKDAIAMRERYEAAGRTASGAVGGAAKTAIRATGKNAALLDLIGSSEGTDKGRGYNETLGYGALTGSQNLTGMTLNQIDALQSGMLKNPRNKWNSSALGRYQITQTTLRRLRRRLGINGNAVFDAAMQDRLASQLIDERTTGKSASAAQNGLAAEWASLPRFDTGASAYGQRTGASSAQLMLAMAQANGAGATAAGNSTVSTNIQQITINTAATDANGIASSIVPAMTSSMNGVNWQANTGMS